MRPLGARARFVTIAGFCNPASVHYMGYSEKAVRRKIEEQVWRKGVHFTRAPDGNILLIPEAIERWVEPEKAAA